jgi:hypothetical protein
MRPDNWTAAGKFCSLLAIMSDDPAKLILGDTAISAIEQSPGKRGLFRRKNRSVPSKTHCENCGAALSGHWCSQCGQAAVDYHRSFRYVIFDALENFISWDSKIFVTFGWLVVKPWRLTNEFIGGRRVRYLHPLRLYLIASVLFFFAVNYWTKSIHLHPKNFSPKERAEVQTQLQDQLKDSTLPAPARVAIEQALRATNASPSQSPGQTEPITSPRPEQSASPKEDDYGPLLKMDSDRPSSGLGKWLEAKAKEKIGEHGSKAELFLATLFQNLPYMMLCCIPLFALVLKLLYVRRKTFYIEHLIYALHIHSFAFVGVTAIVFATIGLHRAPIGARAGLIVAALWTAFGVQIFLSIRKVYRQGWFMSIFKFLFGGFVYLIVLFCALLITFLVTIALP